MVWFEPQTSAQARDTETDQLLNSIYWSYQQMSKPKPDQADTAPTGKPLTIQTTDPEGRTFQGFNKNLRVGKQFLRTPGGCRRDFRIRTEHFDLSTFISCLLLIYDHCEFGFC